MHSVKKLFFIPVGLPGIGKSTLAKHIRLAIEKNLQTPRPSGKEKFALSQKNEISIQDGVWLP